MRFIIAVTVFGFVALTGAQKHPKAGGGKHSGGGGAGHGQQYSPVPSHGGGQYAASPYQGGGGNYNQLGAAKPAHALLLSDSRTLNHDGTINFQYAADNGLQQGETVDPDGTRRGFYSYPGADGKPLTVKYTAGKNGFIAEGDHLPRQPQVPTHSDNDEDYSPKRPQHQHHGSSSSQGQYNTGASPAYSSSQGHGGHGQGSHGNRAGAYSAPHAPTQQYHQAQPQAYSHSPAPQAHRAQPIQYSSGGQGQGQQGFFGGQNFGAVNYGAPSQAAGSQYSSRAQGGGIAYAPASGGQVHSAFNPYQQAGPAGPYAGQFDLGNGGQFSINFNPGKSQEVTTGGDFGGASRRYQ